MNRREVVVGAAALALVPQALAKTNRLTALVTADLESQLVAVDLANGLVTGVVRTLASPRGIATVGDTAVATHWGLNAVSVVDARKLKVAHVLLGFGDPRYTAAHPDGRHAFVTDHARGEIAAIDVVRGRVLARVPVGPHARHLAIDPRGRTLWIALGEKAKEIAVVDVSRPARPRLVQRFRPPFLAHDVGWAPDGRHVWVSSGDKWELAVYDARSGRLLARPTGDQPPQHVAFSGDRAYVTSGWSGTLRVHRVDGKPLLTNAIPVGSYNVHRAFERVLTPSLRGGTLTVLDVSGRVRYRKSVARSAHDVCVI
jgi:DNA-binding beta-propeller fold protein YncE